MDLHGTAVWTDHAVIGRIGQEHDALRDKLRLIHSITDGLLPDTVEVESLLKEFKSMLEFHFVHEEQNGFFHQITERSPRLINRAKVLCEEHQELLTAAKELCRFAAAGSPSVPWWRELRARCHDFSERLLRHEGAESALLHESHRDHCIPND